MSLFKLQELWNTRCGDGEQFDQNCVHIANIDNADDRSDKIIVGSHSGILRIFSVGSGSGIRKFESDHFGDLSLLTYDDNDLLLENQFSQPILQLSSGTLLSASEKRQLLVLFPKKIAVFSVSGSAGVAKFGFSYSLLMIYEHELPRFAYNFVVGNFGHVKGRDFICVQSLDGCLMFFEQESASFIRFLPGFLLPTEFCYLSQSDAFLIQSGDWTLHCYRYQVLAISSSQKEEQNGQGGRRASPDWTLDISQPVQQMQYVSDGETAFICVLTESCLYVLRDSGNVQWQKKLDHSVLYMHGYLLSDQTTRSYLNPSQSTGSFERTSESRLMLMLATDQNGLLLYGEKRLKWACSLPFKAIFMRPHRVAGGALSACLVLLGENGELSLVCLGTSPSIQMVTALRKRRKRASQKRENIKQSEKEDSLKDEPKSNDENDEFSANDSIPVNKQQFDQEMNSLRKIISAFDTDFDHIMKLDSDDGKQSKTEDNKTRLQAELRLDLQDIRIQLLCGRLLTGTDLQANDLDLQQWLIRQETTDRLSMMELKFCLHCAESECNDVRLSISSPGHMHAQPDSFYWAKLTSESSTDWNRVRVWFNCDQICYLQVEPLKLIVTYSNERLVARVLCIEIPIPLQMLCSFVRSQSSSLQTDSSSSFRFSFQSRRSKFDLRLLFEELFNRPHSPMVAGRWTDRPESSLTESLSNQWPGLSSNRILIRCGTESRFSEKASKTVKEQFAEETLVEVTSTKPDDLVLVQMQSTEESSANQSQHSITVTGLPMSAGVFILNELLERLKRMYEEQIITHFEFVRDFLPFSFYFRLVDQHLNLRHQIQQCKQQLEEHCMRYRIIDKRLLIKLKERNLSNLSNLDLLLELYYDKIMRCSSQLMQLEKQFELKCGELCHFGSLIISIIQLLNKVADDRVDILKGILLTPQSTSASEQEGWEERTEQALLNLLGEKAQKSMQLLEGSNNELAMPDTADNLKKLLKILFEQQLNGQLGDIVDFKVARKPSAILEEEEEE